MSAPLLQCRAQHEGDAETLMAIQRSAVLHTFPACYPPAVVQAFLALIEPARFALTEGQPRRWLAVCEQAVLGYASWWPDGRIGGVYVHAAAQQRGVGTYLMTQIEAQARAAALPQLCLSATLPALAFYQRLGFTAGAAQLHTLPGMPPTTMTVVPMHKRVAAETADCGNISP